MFGKRDQKRDLLARDVIADMAREYLIGTLVVATEQMARRVEQIEVGQPTLQFGIVHIISKQGRTS